MKAASQPTQLDIVGLMGRAWLHLRLASADLQLRLVAAHRRRATAELADASAARLAAQDEYAGRIQCLDTRQEQLLEQIITIRTDLWREQQAAVNQQLPDRIRSRREHEAMLWEAECLIQMDPQSGTHAFARLAVLADLIEAYEADFYKLDEEIIALYRIANFQGRHCVAQMDETPSFYTIAVDHDTDTLTAKVDFFLQHQIAKPLLTQVEQEIFDEMLFMPLASEDLQLQLTVQPATKESFKALHCAVRMLLAGASIPTLSEAMDRQTFLRRLQAAIDWNCTLAPLQLDFIPSRTHNH